MRNLENENALKYIFYVQPEGQYSDDNRYLGTKFVRHNILNSLRTHKCQTNIALILSQ